MDGQCRGVGSEPERERAVGRRLALEKAIPGMPPSLTSGRTSSAEGAVSRVALTLWPSVWGSAGSWGALGSSWHLSRPQFLPL